MIRLSLTSILELLRTISTIVKGKNKISQMKNLLLRRIVFFLLFIGLGLLSRSNFISLPVFIDAYIGDVIWAIMVFYMFAILFLKSNQKKLLIATFLFSFAIEFSQLYHAQWIDNIRDIKLFALVLGHGFLWSDLICYTVGIVAASSLEALILKRK